MFIDFIFYLGNLSEVWYDNYGICGPYRSVNPNNIAQIKLKSTKLKQSKKKKKKYRISH